MPLLTRATFQAASWQRLREARSLLRSRHWPGAHYLAGYTIECALKAVIAKQVVRHQFPPKDVSRIYTHSLTKLFAEARLPKIEDAAVQTNWNVVKDWSPDSRYGLEKGERDARDLINAIAGRKGVFGWLRKHW